MNPRELRLGNLLNYHGVNVIVVGINRHEASFGYFQDSVGFDRTYDGDDFPKPIPLTEELLLRFGFEDSNELDRRLYKFNNIDWCLCGQTPFSRYFRVYQILDKEEQGRKDIRGRVFGSFKIYAGQHWVLSVRYVHELQNIYFALTGEELTLKSEI